MLSTQTHKKNPAINLTDGYNNGEIRSPTAEHLEEPSIMGKRESLNATNSGEFS